MDQIRTKYILLETYKRTGDAVRTTVWFVAGNDAVHVVTRTNTGKIKRLRNDPRVKFAPCTIRGRVTGEWHSGVAEILDSSRTEPIVMRRDTKYGIIARLAKLLTRNKGGLVAISISPE